MKEVTIEKLNKAIRLELKRNLKQFQLYKCPGRTIITPRLNSMLHMHRRLQS